MSLRVVSGSHNNAVMNQEGRHVILSIKTIRVSDYLGEVSAKSFTRYELNRFTFTLFTIIQVNTGSCKCILCYIDLGENGTPRLYLTKLFVTSKKIGGSVVITIKSELYKCILGFVCTFSC